MTHSTFVAPSEQPRTPRRRKAKAKAKFPLNPRSDGRWQKKVRGRIRYFYGSADEALTEWLRVKDDLLAGRKPRVPKPQENLLRLADVCNQFLDAKQAKWGRC